eukprot:SM000028S10102  [mRNA]  locus=s28:309761:310456:+ [translate_table: standard]
MSCGAEALVHGIRAALEVDPSTMVLGLDISNAFNTVKRITGCDYKWKLEELAQQRAAAARVALSQRRGRNGSVNQPSQQSTAGNLARARRFGRAGELSRAAQALCPDPLATTNDATEAILRQLHPPPQHPLEPWAGELPSPLDLSAEALRVALTKAPRM